MAQSLPKKSTPRLLVWAPADHRRIGRKAEAMPYALLAETYAQALRDCADAQAMVLPLVDPADI